MKLSTVATPGGLSLCQALSSAIVGLDESVIRICSVNTILFMYAQMGSQPPSLLSSAHTTGSLDSGMNWFMLASYTLGQTVLVSKKIQFFGNDISDRHLH